MSTSLTQRVTLRFVYTYRHPVRIGVYDENHIKLANICKDHIRKLDRLEDDPCLLWDCHPDSITSGYELVEVSVRFVYKLDSDDSTLASPHARRLWRALVELFDHEPSHTLFGGRVYSMNMRPVNLEEGIAIMPYTFGHLVPSLPIEIEHPIQAADIAEMSLGNSLALAADIFLRILEFGAKGAAICTARNLGGIGLDQCFALVTETATSIAPRLDQGSTPTKGMPLSFETVAQIAVQLKHSLSFETAAQIAGRFNNPTSFMMVAQITGEARRKIQPMLHQAITKDALSQIAEVTNNVLCKFDDAHRAAVARVRYSLEKEVASAEAYKEAMDGVCELMTLFTGLRDGSKCLTTVLRNQRKSRNTKLAAVATIAGAAAATVFLGPPAWVAASLAYTGTGVAAASAPYLLIKKVEESGQIEDLQQNSQYIEKLHMKLFFLIVAASVTDIWKFDLESIPPGERENIFRQFGVHKDYFAEKEYGKAHIRDALDELERVHMGLLYKLHGILLDLGIPPEVTQEPSQEPMILPIKAK